MTTETEQETAQRMVTSPYWCCAVCGIGFDTSPYAHNTCSQRCARTAAVVEALDRLATAVSAKIPTICHTRPATDARKVRTPRLDTVDGATYTHWDSAE